MSPRLWVLSLAPLFAAATAHAQAPGQWAEPPPGYGGYAPTPDMPPPPPPPPPLPGRFSIGLNMQSATFSPNTPDTAGVVDSADFNGGSIAVRYRPWRKVELELTLGGGRQTLDGGAEGDLAMATGTLAARYRFNQQNQWNWWLLLGVGATTIARHDATQEEIDAAQRPHLAAGIGLEYRFTNFALQVEARAMGLGQTPDEMKLADQGVYTNDGISGGMMTLGASYYFGR
jgi:opacity protein-like surface antigen